MMRYLRTFLLSLFAMGLIITGCASQHAKPTVHGIDNFGQVAPGIYRGGQPTADGWDYLKSLGVTNVVKLNTDSEGMDPENAFTVIRPFPISFADQLLFSPSRKMITAAVNAIGPNTFIHCTHGQDRTGLIVGEYRVRKCGWTKAQARAEMAEYGFHPILFGLERFWESQGDGPPK